MSTSGPEGLMPPSTEKPAIGIEDCIPSSYDANLLLSMGKDSQEGMAHTRQDVQLMASAIIDLETSAYLQDCAGSASVKELQAKQAELLAALNTYADLWGMDYDTPARRTQFLLVVDACIHDGINLFGRVAMPNPDDVISGGQKFFNKHFVPTPERINEVQSKYIAQRYASISRTGLAPLANLETDEQLDV